MNTSNHQLPKQTLTLIAGKYLPAILSFVALVFLDQITKQYIHTHFEVNEAIPVIKDVFEIRYIRNPGAAWGIFENKQILFCLIAVLAIFFGGVFYHKCASINAFKDLRILTILILAGALGNMIDRVRFHYVIDFFYFKWIDFPVFNVADCYVTIGFFFMILLIFFKYKDNDFDILFRK